MIDILLYEIPVVIVLVVIFPELGVSQTGSRSDLFLTLVALPFAMAIDAVILSLTGTSIGKSLAGIYLADVSGNRVGILKSVERNTLVYIRGLFLGIPILSIFSLTHAYRAVKDDGSTAWDDKTGTRVFSSTNNSFRTGLCILLFFILLVSANIMSKL